MKKFIYLLLILWIVLAVGFVGCQKDDVSSDVQSVSDLTTVNTQNDSSQIVSPRTGTADIIFYRTSLTTDNFLVSSNRVYQIYNKSKVKNVSFVATTQPLINVNGVLLRHYRILITYTDLTTRELVAYSKSSASTFTITPTGTNLLSDSHTAKFLELSQNSTSNGYLYHFWRDAQIASRTWNIKKDGVTLIATKTIDPLDRNSNIFMPPHVH